MSIVLFGVFLGVFFTLAIYTFLYRENPYSRLAEYIFVGAATGYGIAFDLDWLRGQWEGIWSKTFGDSIAFAIAIFLSFLWYFRFSKKYFWLYRIPLSIIVGTTIGLALRAVVFAQVLEQVRATAALPVIGVAPLTAFNNVVTVAIVVCTLLYFTFTVSQVATPWKPINKFARYSMMVGFGSAYGYTVLTRMAIFIGRVQYLLGIPPNPVEAKMFFPWVALVMLATMLGYDYYKRTKK